MRHIPAIVVLAIAPVLISCEREVAVNQQSTPHESVGVYLTIGTAQFTNHKSKDQENLHSLVRSILAENGIDMRSQYKGIAVPYWHARKAREILLTHTGLNGRDVLVSLLVPAGTAKKTNDSYNLQKIHPYDFDIPPSLSDDD